MKPVYKNSIVALLVILLFVSIAGNVRMYISSKHTKDMYIEKIVNPKFELLSPNIAWTNTEEFLKLQKSYSIAYVDLKRNIYNALKNSDYKGHYAVYFEDLNTGAWFGINEKEEFIPASLLKVPLMIATLKKVQNGELSLAKEIVLTKEDIDLRSGTLGLKGAGYKITIKELLTYLIKESDNTVAVALHRHAVSDEESDYIRVALGLNPARSRTDMSPIQYGHILRSLYYSTHLNRTVSGLGLSIMSNTDDKNQLEAGIPSNVRLSHKFGWYSLPGGETGHHDCGIIYYPDKPYILCVMSKNTTQKEADMAISEVSKITYKHIDEEQKAK